MGLLSFYSIARTPPAYILFTGPADPANPTGSVDVALALTAGGSVPSGAFPGFINNAIQYIAAAGLPPASVTVNPAVSCHLFVHFSVIGTYVSITNCSRKDKMIWDIFVVGVICEIQ